MGVVIDLDDIAAVETVFADTGPALTGLLIAHEVGHHVQSLASGQETADSAAAPFKELQADCYAGWWLGRADARSMADTGAPTYRTSDLERRLPEMLRLLSILHAGRLSAASEADRHGSIDQRLVAIQRGIAARDPQICHQAAGLT